MPAVDCRISDPFLDPPGQFDGLFVERVERLPHCFWCIWGIEQPTIGPLPALTEGTVTFGSLNEAAKVGAASIALWAQVLNAVPRSRMRILASSQRHRQRIMEQFAAAGVASDRIRLISRMPRPQYLDAFNQIDIFLDSLPYNAHTTGLEAMWMGVPIVTMVGKRLLDGRACRC